MLALQPLRCDAPNPAANLASALSIADARIIAEAFNAIGACATKARAMKRVRAPVVAHGDRPLLPAGRGDRRIQERQPGCLSRLMLSAYALASPP